MHLHQDSFRKMNTKDNKSIKKWFQKNGLYAKKNQELTHSLLDKGKLHIPFGQMTKDFEKNYVGKRIIC